MGVGVPFTSNQSRTEAAKNGKKGGKASGKARRQKAELRNLAKELLSLDTVVKIGGEPQVCSHGMALVLSLIQKAESPKHNQSVAAAKTLIQLVGADRLEEEIQLIKAQAKLTEARAEALKTGQNNGSNEVLDEILRTMREEAEKEG